MTIKSKIAITLILLFCFGFSIFITFLFFKKVSIYAYLSFLVIFFHSVYFSAKIYCKKHEAINSQTARLE